MTLSGHLPSSAARYIAATRVRRQLTRFMLFDCLPRFGDVVMYRHVLLVVFAFLFVLRVPQTLAAPIHEAARNGDVDRIEQLLAQGADLEERDQTQETPLISAALAGQLDTVGSLISKGADVHARNDRGLTALHAAAYGGYPKIVRLLIEHGAMVNDAQNPFKITPLHAAAEEDQIEVVQVLIGAKANLESTEVNGYTPLSRAGFREHWDVVTALLKAGASCQPAEKVGDWLFAECAARRK